jgi:hypothetical protein
VRPRSFLWLTLVCLVISGMAVQQDSPPPPRPNAPEIRPDGYGLAYERPGGGTTTAGPPVDCSWNIFPITGLDGSSDAEATTVRQQGVEEVGPDGRAYRSDPLTGSRMVLYFRSGSDCASGLVWVSTALTARSLIPTLRLELEEVLDLPVPNMSPDPSVGSVVNLGLWVAIKEPGVSSVRLTDGPVWAEGNGQLVGFDVDFGDGNNVSCGGLGVPYPEGSNNADPGPCGHVYRQRSPDGAPFPLTITSRYEVTYRLSNGESGSLGTVSRAATFDYPVIEIVTVGSGR